MTIEHLLKMKARIPGLRRIHIIRNIPLSVRWRFARLRYKGSNHYCPICESHVDSFLESGHIFRRLNGECPVCQSWERHRLGWYFLTSHSSALHSDYTFLHIAPEPQLQYRLKSAHNLNYITADLLRHDVHINLDLVHLPFKKNSIDIIYCSHVLEHVPDDLAAMREMYRVLKANGWCLLMVPMHEDKTIEDPTVTDVEERIRRFGQEDHVRIYGPDLAERLSSCGYMVQQFQAADLVGADQLEQMGIKGERFFVCTKV